MNDRPKLKLILLLLFCFFCSKQVLAHDPGLSTAEVRLDQNGISVELALAPSDVERIVDIDSNGDQRISVQAFEQAKSRLLTTAAEGFEVQSDSQHLTASEQNASYRSEEHTSELQSPYVIS